MYYFLIICLIFCVFVSSIILFLYFNFFFLYFLHIECDEHIFFYGLSLFSFFFLTSASNVKFSLRFAFIHFLWHEYTRSESMNEQRLVTLFHSRTHTFIAPSSIAHTNRFIVQSNRCLVCVCVSCIIAIIECGKHIYTHTYIATEK